uniref:EF-hand domain-containing protein n=1 Tax=Pavo cristatus TaxID=9049 RepID=A0A8C9FCF0_PAVCR
MGHPQSHIRQDPSFLEREDPNDPTSSKCFSAMKGTGNRPDYLKKLFEETDLNKDKELTFEEFTIVLAKVTDDAHRLMHKEDRCKPDSN